MCHFYVGVAQNAISIVLAVKESPWWKQITEGIVHRDDGSSVGLVTGENRKLAGLWSTYELVRVWIDMFSSFQGHYEYMRQ